MTWLELEMTVLDAARSAAGISANWFIQSTLLILGGLLIGYALRRKGSAAQSAVYRTTLVAALACPFATWALSQLGLTGWSLEMPVAYAHETAPVSPQAESTVQGIEPTAPVPELSLKDDRLAAIETFPVAPGEDAPTITIGSDNLGSQAVPVPTPSPAPRVLASAPATTSAIHLHIFGAAALGVSVIWATGTAWLVTRLVTGWRRLSRIRRGASWADSTTLQICQTLSKLLHVVPPDVLHSPFLPSPCLAGLRRPAVLLPEAELGLSLRDVLIHEMAHLARRDGHWNLLRRIATSLFFFQPLLWLLSRRLDSAAEEVCDDYVVHFGGDRHEYAHRLVDIAELGVAPWAAAGVGIVSLRSMLAARVARIMDTSRSLSTRIGTLLLAIVLLAGFTATLLVGLVGVEPTSVAAEPPDAETTTHDANSTEPPVNVADDKTFNGSEEDVITVRGRVVDPTGVPVPSADVYVLRWYWNFGDPKPLAQAKSDADGRFEISYRKSQFFDAGRPDQWREAYIVAFGRDLGPGWVSYRDLSPGEEPTIKLVVDDVPIEGRIVDLEGRPVADASIEMGSIQVPRGKNLDEWLELVRAGQAPELAHVAFDDVLPVSSAGRWRDIRTDADGRFRMTGIGSERLVALHVKAPTIVTKSLHIATRLMEPLAQPAFNFSNSHEIINYGAQFEHPVAPSRPIEGLVRDAKTSEPIEGAEIWSWKFAGENIGGITTTKTKSDRAGRYRLEGMPKGEGNRIVVVPTELPYFTAEFEVPDPPGIETAKLDIDLHRGIWVTGQVTDKETGRGVLARMYYIASPDNPLASELPEFENAAHIMRVQDRYETEDDGSYRVVALPGRGIIGVNSILNPYPTGQGYDEIPDLANRDGYSNYNSALAPSKKFPTAVKEVRIPESSEGIVCNFELDPGLRVTLRTLDPDDRPLANVSVNGSRGIHDNEREMAEPEFELVALRSDEERTVLLHHEARKLGKALRVKAADWDAGPISVRLEPCATITGRLVDGDREPARGVKIRIDVAGDADYGRMLPSTTTDEGGSFRHEAFLPGLAYNIYAEGAKIEFATVARNLDVKPGETIDLGTIDITSDERPEPMRMMARSAAKNANNLPAAALKPNAEKVTTVRGRVLGPDGKAVAGANVAVIGMGRRVVRGGDLDSYRTEVFSESTTDADGNYELKLAGVSSLTHSPVALIVRANRTGLAWRQLEPDAEIVEASFELRAEELIRGRLVDIEGQPAAGVRISIQAVSVSAKEGEPLISRDGVGFRGSDDPPAAWPAALATDVEGRFTIRGISAGHGVFLSVVGSDRFAPQSLALNTGMAEQRGKRDGTYRPQAVKNLAPGGEAVLALAPAQVFDGTVSYEDTGAPAPHARITIWASQQEMGSMISVAGVADAEGRYRISPNPGIRFGVTAYPPDGEPYLTRQLSPVKWEDGATRKEVDVKLPRGVLVRGKVIELDGGVPVTGATIQYIPEQANNPHYSEDILTGWQGIQLSNEKGEFEIVVLPGPGNLLVHGPQNEFVIRETSDRQLRLGKPGGRRQYANAITPINPAVGAEPLDVLVKLERGVKITGRLVNEAGEPIDEATLISQLNIVPTTLSWRGDASKQVMGGLFELSPVEPSETYIVHFLDAKHRLGATTRLTSQNDSQTVTLKPCGQATARFIDAEGQPMAGHHPSLHMVVTPGSSHYDFGAAERGEVAADADFISNIDRTNYPDLPSTDEDGRVTFPALIPGATYRVMGYEKGGLLVAKEFTVVSQQTHDLGTIVIEKGN